MQISNANVYSLLLFFTIIKSITCNETGVMKTNSYKKDKSALISNDEMIIITDSRLKILMKLF